jgi:uncharacterized protein
MQKESVIGNPASGWRPARSGERILTIDIIRGLALFGVLIVNILGDFRLPLLEHILKRYAGLEGADRVVEILAAGVLEFKAITIFSFLFGAGIAIQMERASAHNVNARYFLARRLGWLLVLGAMHLLLIWNGDILALYALCGVLLLPLAGLPWQMLVLIGTAFVALPEFAWFGIHVPSGLAAISEITRTREAYGNGGYIAILKFRWQETWSFIVTLLIAVMPRTFGLFCWGVAAWRSGILMRPLLHRGKLAVCLVAGAAAGGVITANEVWAGVSGHAYWPALQHTHLDASILLALAYVSGLLLWLTPQRATRMPGLAAMGRMALTNYLMQSIVLGWVFYGYGFGLFGQIGPAAAAAIGVAIYVMQVYLSRLYLQRFRFGPFEWLWRSLSYGVRQPMRRGPDLSRGIATRAGIIQGRSNL